MSINVKPFRIDFKYIVENTASMYIVAENEAAAREGAKQMLQMHEQEYTSPEITTVEEYKREEPTVNEVPRFN